MKLTEKGKRLGRELTWKDLVSEMPLCQRLSTLPSARGVRIRQR